MGKDLSTIKLSVGNNLKLNLEDKKIDKLLIAGNTINFFGFLNNGDLDYMSMGDEDRKRYLWLLKRAIERTEIFVIGEVEEKEHYIELFNHFGQQGVRVNWKYIETFEPKDYLKIIDKIKNMKFDVCVMNPPYDKSLHLKILEKVIDISENTISIQPSGWITDTYAEEKRSAYNKYKKTIVDKIEHLELFDWQDASIMFGIISHQGVGIFQCSNDKIYDSSQIKYIGKSKTIIDICINQDNLESVIEFGKIEGIRVKVAAIKNGAPAAGAKLTKRYKENIVEKYGLMYTRYSSVFVNGYGIDDNKKWWSQYGNKNKYTKEIGDPIPCSIKFDTIEEAQNFEEYCKTKFFIYCMYLSKVGVNTDFKHLPWLGEVKWEGKSGKIDGYKYPITDEILYEYFNLQQEDIDIINKLFN